MTRYLADIRTQIHDGPRPIQLKDWAKKTGLPYARLDLLPITQHVNHPTFRGTHYYGLRRVQAGELYLGGNHAENPNSLYYANGIVEQPGYHASVWKLIEFQDMRERSSSEVIDRAWPAFEQELRWLDTQTGYQALDRAFEAAIAAKIAEADKAGRKLSRNAARSLAYADLSEGPLNLKLIEPLFIKPGSGLSPAVNPKSVLGLRVQDALNRDGTELYPSNRTLLREGDILGPALSPGYRAGFIARVEKVIAPAPTRFKIDHAARRQAVESLRLERIRQKLARARTASRWGVLKHRYKLDAPDLAAAMGDKKRRGN